ncbi:hypothetical protein [Streptomyces sp. TRM75561]|uniref:hypothetical protein n=1 Tax=Streptomyces sp. TRM75561 TaxID=2975269 RepID=UPI0024487779|nr:hypothetical protein [Streptomyces sp. TRM75561]MDH3033031.1 hypothetical protein [Streptomyces sp. TRM75561]
MQTPPQTTDELYAALRENSALPYGRTRTVAAEELAEAAELFGEPVPLVHALLDLQEAYTYGSEPRKSPVVFARLLNLFDERPDVFDDRLRHQLFWRFKWVANALRCLPEIPLASLRQWQTEMRDRYEKAGLDLQPYYGQAYQLAAHVGEDTTLAYELWAGRARSLLSDCEACETCERALYHLAAGDDERALRIWEPVLAGKESCQEEPARSVSYALLPLLRTGRTDEARHLHLAGYRGCRRNPSMAGEIGRHLEFCALTGNEARGLELLAENRNLFDEVDSPLALLDLLTGVEVLLARVEALGHGELPAAGFPGRSWTVTELRAEVRGRADDLAARFDARNGTTEHADRRGTRLAQAPLLESLELTLRPRTLEDVAPAPAAPAPAPAEPLPESPADLIRRARELDEQGHPDAHACWARLRELTAARGYVHPDDPDVGPLVRLRAELLEEEATLADRRDAHEDAAALYEEAAGLYEDAGLPERAVPARAQAVLAGARVGPGGSGPTTPESDTAGGSGTAQGPGTARESASGARAGRAQEAGSTQQPASAEGSRTAHGSRTARESASAGQAGHAQEADSTQQPASAEGSRTAHGSRSTPASRAAAGPGSAEGSASAEGPGSAEGSGPAAGSGHDADTHVAALVDAYATLVRLHEEASGLAPFLEARLLRLRVSALGLRLQASGDREQVASVLAEAELLHDFAARHGLAGQIAGARLLRATTHAMSGDLPAALAETDALVGLLRTDGPAWHLPRVLALRGKIQLGVGDAEAAHASLAEGLRLAAEWPADTVDAPTLHGELAQACLRLGRPDEALRHLTRSAELDLRAGNRFDAFCSYSNAAQLSLDLGRVEDCIALLDSVLLEPDVVDGELDDRLVAQLRLTRARALHAGDDLKAATAEFVALAAESAGWDDDPGSHAMIAAETAVLLGEAGEFGQAREAVDRALAAHARDPRFEMLSNALRELARLQAHRQGPDGLEGARAFLQDAGRVADAARAAGFEAHGRSLDSALAYEHGRVNAYGGAYEEALAALEKALGLLGEPGEDATEAAEWAECVRLAGVVEGVYLERSAAALGRVGAAAERLTALGHGEVAEALTELAERLRDEE